MKALLLSDYRQLEIVDLPMPVCGPDQLLIKVDACGICGSDVHGFDGSSGRRIPPIVMGHEAAGTIAEVGREVTKFKTDQRVTFDSTISCGECAACAAGAINLCGNRKVLGVSCENYRQYGAFAEYVAVPARVAYRIPDSLPAAHAAMVEPVSIAIHATGHLQVQPGETAAVIGAGMIGSLVIQSLLECGCEQVIAIDIDEGRLALARELGATATINNSDGDAGLRLTEAVQSSGLPGVDVAFEVVGHESTLQTAIQATRRGGRIGLIGNLQPDCNIPLQVIVTNELSLNGCCASNGEYPRCIELMANQSIKVQPLISAEAPLEEGSEWFDRLYVREPGLMKVILRP